ncbi:MAG: SufS family cysteine desulfurase [Candidatus Azosocius agrarius]|nr:MAG: SufS family cysteine desulfurase [Gammaproteobacteria bacterium]
MNNYIKYIRNEFSIFNKKINGFPLSYLDNAASSHMPKNSINVLKTYYENSHSNIHRGTYYLSEKNTYQFENTRQKIKIYINAKYTEECIFVKGTTEAINLIASTFGEKYIKENDEIIITEMEHHSNIIPWQTLCKKKKAILKILPIKINGELDIKQLNELLSKNTKLISIIFISNVLGTINPIKHIINIAQKKGIYTLIDGAQALSHLDVDVQNINCDFFTFSAHKLYGPTGLGILYCKKYLLNNIQPYQTGGSMVSNVHFNKSFYKNIPHKFEAGTPTIANVIAFGETLNFLQSIDKNIIYKHESELLKYANYKLLKIPELNIIGNSINKTNIISFTIKNIHSHDISTIANEYGVAVRAGHHCAIPIMNFFKIPATTRLSIGMYNTYKEIDMLYKSLLHTIKLFKKIRN